MPMKNGLQDRPHPGPLPQEREDRSPRFGDAEVAACRATFSTNAEVGAVAPKMNELSSTGRKLSLSPRERVGVRASVRETNSSPVCRNEDSVLDRPHPGLLPRGEGITLVRCLKTSQSHPTQPACLLRFRGRSDLTKGGRPLSLSPGERVGVRASVHYV